MSKQGKELMEAVKAKEVKTYTGKQIAWATTKIVILLVVGVAIGVFAQRALDSTVHAQVVSQVQSLTQK